MAKKLTPEEYRRRQTAYQVEYNAKNKTRVPLDLSNKYDNDILAYLQTVTNKQGLIKELLRARMLEDGFTYSAPDPSDTEETE